MLILRDFPFSGGPFRWDRGTSNRLSPERCLLKGWKMSPMPILFFLLDPERQPYFCRLPAFLGRWVWICEFLMTAMSLDSWKKHSDLGIQLKGFFFSGVQYDFPGNPITNILVRPFFGMLVTSVGDFQAPSHSKNPEVVCPHNSRLLLES